MIYSNVKYMSLFTGLDSLTCSLLLFHYCTINLDSWENNNTWFELDKGGHYKTLYSTIKVPTSQCFCGFLGLYLPHLGVSNANVDKKVLSIIYIATCTVAIVMEASCRAMANHLFRLLLLHLLIGCGITATYATTACMHRVWNLWSLYTNMSLIIIASC